MLSRDCPNAKTTHALQPHKKRRAGIHPDAALWRKTKITLLRVHGRFFGDCLPLGIELDEQQDGEHMQR